MGRRKTKPESTFEKKPPGRPRKPLPIRVGRLKFIRVDPNDEIRVLCNCDCGTKLKSILRSNYIAELTKSCGCLRVEKSRKNVAVATAAAKTAAARSHHTESHRRRRRKAA